MSDTPPVRRLRLARRPTPYGLSAALVVVLTLVMSLLPVPYVGLHPGPATNTLGSVDGKPLILVEGLPKDKIYPASGTLDLTTVSVDSGNHRMNLGEAVLDWFDPHVAVVPRELIYPSDQTTQQVEQQNAEEMTSSQQNAIAAALHALKIPVTQRPMVQTVLKDSPAVGVLHAGDLVLAVDGTAVTTPSQVVDAVRKHKPGDPVSLRIKRDQKTLDVRVTSVNSTQKPGTPMIGITVGQGYDYGFTIKIQLDNVGGPSAGLMFALGIYDKLSPSDLTGGHKIAGTGEITPDGKVGEIGGIQQKLRGAYEAGARVFLVPAGNCADAAAATPKGMRLVKVTTLSGALGALAQLRDGGNPASCTR